MHSSVSVSTCESECTYGYVCACVSACVRAAFHHEHIRQVVVDEDEEHRYGHDHAQKPHRLQVRLRARLLHVRRVVMATRDGLPQGARGEERFAHAPRERVARPISRLGAQVETLALGWHVGRESVQIVAEHLESQLARGADQDRVGQQSHIRYLHFRFCFRPPSSVGP